MEGLHTLEIEHNSKVVRLHGLKHLMTHLNHAQIYKLEQDLCSVIVRHMAIHNCPAPLPPTDIDKSSA